MDAGRADASTDTIERGRQLLAQISDAIVQAQKEDWGKGPERASVVTGVYAPVG